MAGCGSCGPIIVRPNIDLGEPCGDSELLQLCDRIDESPEPQVIRFLRRLTFDCQGALIDSVDRTLEGEEYDVQGEVGACDPDPALCGLPTDAVTSGETNSGAEGEMSATDTPPTLATTGDAHTPLPGGGQSLWDGGSLVFPPDPDASEGDGGQIYRWVAAQLVADRPECDDGTVHVTASVRVALDGPTEGFLYTGALKLYAGDSQVDIHKIQQDAPVGHQETLTVSAKLPAAQFTDGDVQVALGTETFHRGEKQWTADQFVATYAYNTDGCEEQLPTVAVRLCEPVTVKYEPPPVDPGGGVTPQILTREACDDTTGDGVSDTRYTELWSVVPGQQPELEGAYLNGDFGQPYQPNNPAPCPDDEGVSDMCCLTERLVFDTCGAHTFDPAAYPNLKRVNVKVVGGGGAGGGCVATGGNERAVSGGGGGGGYAERLIEAADLGTTPIDIQVGCGGDGAAPGGGGGGGEFSAFGTLAFGLGGSGGNAGNAGNTTATTGGGAGGAASGGDINITGSEGGSGRRVDADVTRVGSGGASGSGWGGTAQGGGAPSGGTAGQPYGGGSSGTSNTLNDPARGSEPGGDGVVLVEVYGA